MFNVGEIYKRSALHDKYGGQEQGGISTPSRFKIILLFTSNSGEQYGYSDGWSEDRSIFYYTGEGQLGDMTFTRGNKAIRDHLNNGTEIHLFEYIKQGYVRYVGKMTYSGFEHKEGKDKNGELRKIIIFKLAPLNR
jgi:5-methylcytosine-specific restriction enzyme A